MDYRRIGNTGFNASPLGFGCMRLPTMGGSMFGADIDESEAIRMIRYAIDNGINYVDTAYTYHEEKSEEVLGKALEGGYREKVALADKSPVFLIKKETDFDEMLETQLRRLNTEYIDFYLLHALSAYSFEKIVKRFGLLDKIERAKKAGKIGHIGFSFHDHYDAFATILNGYDGWEFCQIQLNYLDPAAQAGIKGLQEAADKGLGVVIMEPLLGGKLANLPKNVKEIFGRSENERTPVEWALDYLWDMPQISIVLSGMTTMQQTKENVAYAKKASINMLSEEDKSIIRQAKVDFENKIAVSCTGCGYCMPCKQGVNIPQNFAAYNELFFYEDNAVPKRTLNQMTAWFGEKSKASSCTACRRCEKLCPQQIEISSKLAEVAKAFRF